jgi:hypothetical protein
VFFFFYSSTTTASPLSLTSAIKKAQVAYLSKKPPLKLLEDIPGEGGE